MYLGCAILEYCNLIGWSRATDIVKCRSVRGMKGPTCIDPIYCILSLALENWTIQIWCSNLKTLICGGAVMSASSTWLPPITSHVVPLVVHTFPRFHLAPPCPAKSMFLWETEDISPWVNFCCLTCISVVDSYIWKIMAARVVPVVEQEGCEKARTCQELMT